MNKNRPFFERLGYACSGIRAAWREEPSFRTQSWCALAVVAVLAGLRPAPLWWALLLAAAGLVLAAEMFNTALERVIDHLHPEHHPMMAVAKDCAAGAVLVAAVTALAVFIVFLTTAWHG